MYESPIEIIQHKIRSDINERVDDAVYTAVIRADIHVEREELIKALKYERDQYNNGYADGMAAASPHWISVKDRLPPRYKKILVVNGHGYVNISAFVKELDGEWTWLGLDGKYNHINDITHWMPLPEPPKEER